MWEMRRHWDVVVGVATTVGTWNLAEVSSLISCIIGLLTAILMSFRVRREYLRRNAGFKRDAKGRIVTDFHKEVPDDDKI